MSDDKKIEFRVEADAQDAASSLNPFLKKLDTAKDRLVEIEKALARVNRVSQEQLAEVGMQQRRLRQISAGTPTTQVAMATQRRRLNEIRSNGARAQIAEEKEREKTLRAQLVLLDRAEQKYRDLANARRTFEIAARQASANPSEATRANLDEAAAISRAAANAFPAGMRKSMFEQATGVQRPNRQEVIVRRTLENTGAFSNDLDGLTHKQRRDALKEMVTELRATSRAMKLEEAEVEKSVQLRRGLNTALETATRVAKDNTRKDQLFNRQQQRDFRRIVQPGLSVENDPAERQRILDSYIKTARDRATRAGRNFDPAGVNQSFVEYEHNRAIGQVARDQRRTTADAKYETDRPTRARRSIDSALDRFNDRGGAGIFAIQGTLLRNYALQGAVLGTGAFLSSFTVKYEQELAQLQAISASTNTEMEKLEGTIARSAENSKYAAVEIVQASTAMAQAGLSSRDIDKSLGSVLKLATATGTDLSTTVDVVTSTLSVFKLQTSEAAQVTDVLTEAMNRSKLDVTKFATGLQYAGNIAADSGVSYIELTAALSGMANQGIRTGSTLGTGLRQLLTDLQNPTDKARAHFESMGLSMSDLDVRANGLFGVLRNMQRAGFSTADAMQTLEVRSAAAYTALTNNLPLVEALRGQLTGTGSATRAANVQMNTFTALWTQFMNTAGISFTKLVEPMTEALKLLLKGVTAVLKIVTIAAPVMSVLIPPLLMFGVARLAKDLGGIAMGLAEIAGLGGRASAALGAVGAATSGFGRGGGGGGGWFGGPNYGPKYGPQRPPPFTGTGSIGAFVGMRGTFIHGMELQDENYRDAKRADIQSRLRTDFQSTEPLHEGQAFALNSARRKMNIQRVIVDRLARETTGIRMMHQQAMSTIDRELDVLKKATEQRTYELFEVQNKMRTLAANAANEIREKYGMARGAPLMLRGAAHPDAPAGAFDEYTARVRRGNGLLEQERDAIREQARKDGIPITALQRQKDVHQTAIDQAEKQLTLQRNEFAAASQRAEEANNAYAASVGKSAAEVRTLNAAQLANAELDRMSAAALHNANIERENANIISKAGGMTHIPLLTRANHALNASVSAARVGFEKVQIAAGGFFSKIGANVTSSLQVARNAMLGLTASVVTGFGSMAAAALANPFTSFMVAVGVVISAWQVIDMLWESSAEKADRLASEVSKLQGDMDGTSQSAAAVADQLKKVNERSIDLSGASGNLADQQENLRDMVDEVRLRFMALGLQMGDNVGTIGEVRDALLELQTHLNETLLMQSQLLNSKLATQEAAGMQSFENQFRKGQRELMRPEGLFGAQRAAELVMNRPDFNRAASGQIQIQGLTRGDVQTLQALRRLTEGSAPTGDRLTSLSRYGGAALGIEARLRERLESGGVTGTERAQLTHVLEELTRINKFTAGLQQQSGDIISARAQRLQNLPSVAAAQFGMDPGYNPAASRMGEAMASFRSQFTRIQDSGVSADQRRAAYEALKQDPTLRAALESLRGQVEAMRMATETQLIAQGVDQRSAAAYSRTAAESSGLGHDLAVLDQKLNHSVFADNEQALRQEQTLGSAQLGALDARQTALVRSLRGARAPTMEAALADAARISSEREAAKLLEYDATNNVNTAEKGFALSAIGIGRDNLKQELETRRLDLIEQIKQAYETAARRSGSGRRGTDAGQKYLELLVREQTEVLDTITKNVSRTDDVAQLMALRDEFDKKFADYRQARIDLFNETWDNTQWTNPAEAAAARDKSLASVMREIDEKSQQAIDGILDRLTTVVLKSFETMTKRIDDALKDADRELQDRLRPYQAGVSLMQGLANRGRVSETRQQLAQDNLEHARVGALPDQLAAYERELTRKRQQEAELTLARDAATNPTSIKQYEDALLGVTQARKDLEEQIRDIRADYAANTQTTMGSNNPFSAESINLMRAAVDQWKVSSGILQSGADVAADGIKSAFDALNQGLKATIKDLVTGAATIEDTFRNMGIAIVDALLDSAVKAMTNEIIQWFLNLIASSFGGTNAGAKSTIGASKTSVKPVGRAGGGVVPNGIPNRDSVHALLEPGEVIMRKTAVDMIGKDTLMQMNATGRTAASGATNIIAMQKRDPDMVNVYVIPPEQQPQMTSKDVVVALQRDVERGGPMKKLIKAVAVGGM